MANSVIFIPWDGWELVRGLGHGSFGKVYEIRRSQSGRVEKAAMKVISISSDMLDDMYGSQYDEDTAKKLCEDSLRNIKKEFELMYELRGNPNIVRVDEMKVVGHQDGIGCDVYIKMELLTPLQKILKAGEITEADVFDLGTDICRALMVCEQHKIIHRDIKPQNILVTDAGTYKLGDFGTARTFEHTVSATMAGTETYMAPEVIRREKYGRDVDTYSLGLVMHRMLNKGQLPFLPVDKVPTSKDRERSLQRRITGERIPAPVSGSPALSAVVLKACSYDRKDRYLSASDMLEDLMLAAEGTMPMFPHDKDNDETVIERTSVGRNTGTGTKKNTGKSAGKNTAANSKRRKTDANTNGNGRTVKAGGKPRSKVGTILIVIAVLVAASIIYGLVKGMQDSETSSLTEDTPDSITEQSENTYSEPVTTTGEDEMAWIEYEMWDYPSKGSGADNSDENHATFWTVYYDRDTGVFHKIMEEQWFNMNGYSEEDVKEYVDRLSSSWSGDEYSFIEINYKGGVTGDFGNQFVLQIEYNNIDDASRQALADHIFMATDWGTTITDAEKVIKALGGERYRGSITSEEEAIEWADYFANAKQLVPTGVTVGFMPEGTTTDSNGHITYTIRVYEDHPDHIATLYWWDVNIMGTITDNESGSVINDLQYPDY